MNLFENSSSGLALIDWIIVALYALGTILLGSYYSRRQTSLEEYFTGGGRMNPTLIGVSLMATSLSSIGYLSIPGEAISKGPVGLANQLAHPFIFVVVGFIFILVFMRTRVISAYELLEERLGLGIRMLGAVLFLLFRLVWMSLLVFLAAQALAIMMGLDESWIPWITLITGLIAVTYTSLGGLRAVVITDGFQTLFMLGGALLVIGLVTYRMGGLGWFPTSWQPHWDQQPLFSFDPSVRLSILGTIFSTFILASAGLAGDQTKIQRLMATTDARAARRAYATNQIVGIGVVVTLWLVGFALLGLVQNNPELLPAGIDTGNNGDKVFPYFISYLLPPGISGLVVAAMLAAAMSSIDSGVNSITAVIDRDFLHRFGRLPSDPKVQARWAKILAFVIGAVKRFHGRRPRQHLGGDQEDLGPANDPHVRSFLLRLFRALCPPPGRRGGRHLRSDDGGAARLFWPDLRKGPDHRSRSRELHVDRTRSIGRESGRGHRHQLRPACLPETFRGRYE